MSEHIGYFLKSDRLGFRTWRAGDIELALLLWGDSKVTKYIVSSAGLSREDVEDRLKREVTSQRDYGVQYWPIFELESGEFVGCCGLRRYRDKTDILEIGCHICSAYWRRGFAFEALSAVIHYAFERLHVNGLFAGHNPANDASRRLLAKLGFRHTHDEFYEPTGLNHPSYLLTREEYLLNQDTES